MFAVVWAVCLRTVTKQTRTHLCSKCHSLWKLKVTKAISHTAGYSTGLVSSTRDSALRWARRIPKDLFLKVGWTRLACIFVNRDARISFESFCSHQTKSLLAKGSWGSKTVFRCLGWKTELRRIRVVRVNTGNANWPGSAILLLTWFTWMHHVKVSMCPSTKIWLSERSNSKKFAVLPGLIITVISLNVKLSEKGRMGHRLGAADGVDNSQPWNRLLGSKGLIFRCWIDQTDSQRVGLFGQDPVWESLRWVSSNSDFQWDWSPLT